MGCASSVELTTPAGGVFVACGAQEAGVLLSASLQERHQLQQGPDGNAIVGACVRASRLASVQPHAAESCRLSAPGVHVEPVADMNTTAGLDTHALADLPKD